MIRKKRPGPPRRGPLRSEGYRSWCASPEVECVACKIIGFREEIAGIQRTCLAHGPVNGMSSKGPDNEGIPLCWALGTLRHHEEQTVIGWPAFEAKYQFSRAAEAAKHWARYLESTGGKP